MRPLEMMNPGQGRTGAANVKRQLDCFYPNRFSTGFQVTSRLLFLELLIPADGHFERDLSLRLDSAHVEREALKERGRSGLEHVGLIVARVLADLERRCVREGE
jgi:hypothetical protein